jgi:hypothetical protein
MAQTKPKNRRTKEEKERQRQIKIFAEILGKDNCTLTHEKLEKTFYTIRKPGRTSVVPLMPGLAAFAFRALKNKQIRELPKDKIFEKKIHSLKSSLSKILTLMSDSDIEAFYRFYARRDHEVSEKVIMDSYYNFQKNVMRESARLGIYLYEEKNPGRPSLFEFYDFVFKLAQTYEDISGNKFTFFRHKETSGKNRGQYVAVTDGHRFVNAGIEWMYKMFDENNAIAKKYTDKNICNACEAAQKHLKNKPR